MLFLVKTHAARTFGLAVLLIAACWPHVCDSAGAATLRAVTLGLGLVALSDAVLHVVLLVALRDRYLYSYRALVDLYAPHDDDPAAVVAGGVLAGCEELLFRGVLILALTRWLSPLASLLCSALAFAAAHAIWRPRLRVFAIWAAWEGVLLGIVSLYFGSLTSGAIVHALHDAGGFALFAVQRRTGWLLGRSRTARADRYRL